MTLIAGRDLTTQGSEINGGGVTLAAGRDLTLGDARTQVEHFRQEQSDSGGGWTALHTPDMIAMGQDWTQRHSLDRVETKQDSSIGTLVSGTTVTASAGQNLSVLGSAVVGDGNVTLAAGTNRPQ